MRTFLFVFFISIALVSFATFAYYSKYIFERKVVSVSPLPSFLNFMVNSQVSTLDVWRPDVRSVVKSSALKPQIPAKSALVYDTTTGKTLYAKDPLRKLPMASLTKIMTAVISIENKRADDKYKVSKKDLVGEDSMGLTTGEVLSLDELLYGLMLNSGNDAAEVLASNYPLGRDNFILAMNSKAKSLGLLDTHFTNPTGLEGDGNQYTTAYGLLVITKYALGFEIFRNVVSTFDYHISYSREHKEFYLENQTNLLTSYPGVYGVKTGFTPEAGLCLVTYLNYKGHEIIGVLLGSDNRRQEMKNLLDYSLKAEGVPPPQHQ